MLKEVLIAGVVTMVLLTILSFYVLYEHYVEEKRRREKEKFHFKRICGD